MNDTRINVPQLKSFDTFFDALIAKPFSFLIGLVKIFIYPIPTYLTFFAFTRCTGNKINFIQQKIKYFISFLNSS